jgi:hypothetical protein
MDCAGIGNIDGGEGVDALLETGDGGAGAVVHRGIVNRDAVGGAAGDRGAIGDIDRDAGLGAGAVAIGDILVGGRARAGYRGAGHRKRRVVGCRRAGRIGGRGHRNQR